MTSHQNPNPSTNPSSTTASLDLRPFTVDVPQDAIDDLYARLDRTRYAAEPADTAGTHDWSAGAPVAWLREMVAHWRGDFDWRAQEQRMNAYPQFLTEIDGQTVHLVHVRSANEDATPLLLLHTYPGSFAEFLDLVPHLTDDFHLVIPSLPGIGFSQPLADGAWDSPRIARAWNTLMRGLGYESYGAHGSDNGAIVSRELAMLAPEGFLGAHVLQLFSFPSGDPAEFERMAPADYAALEFAGWFQTVNGFATMNASRPQTIAAALSDSPVGQLAYNELFESFGTGTSLLSREQVLTQVSLYWFTNSSAGAARLYHADRDGEPRVNEGRIGVAVFADDFRSMRPFAERDNTFLASWTEHPRGGHFAAMEVPEELAAAIRGFFA
ncbi:epoxide hydrolase family protein [Nocardioides sp. zg-1228]|uniref:epoxide hydrolase family protein n=1 Tax=Nocardioides sp. zg-1228 TaxID=2763008 RepID=UPI001642E59E|nr:epoxide hydrolase family protein [Nocardioides sp. zg-1228]MBC2935103.1 epoxide hydrolase [Nocardioides sp. zg-1228]QSF56067.1 epoxide hydrolase [Nocardioides sp. zg-1228]